MSAIKKTMTCTVCPVGCALEALLDGGEIVSVTGNTCRRGDAYARAELTAPVRTLTSTVALHSESERLLAVRTDRPIPKDKLFEAMTCLKATAASAPVKRGDIIVADIAGTGANAVASKTVER